MIVFEPCCRENGNKMPNMKDVKLEKEHFKRKK